MSGNKEHQLDPATEEYFTEEQKAYIKEMVEKLMEKRILVIYGDEDEKAETVILHDEERRGLCKSVCCSFIFALTKSDVGKGIIQWNPKRPYFIATEEDGYCSHFDRKTLLCTIWEDRPERCRNYDCRKDANVWEDWGKEILNKDVFKHLPGSNSQSNIG